MCNPDTSVQGYGTALGLITYLHETGKLKEAYFTQSTPYHQGSRSVRFPSSGKSRLNNFFPD